MSQTSCHKHRRTSKTRPVSRWAIIERPINGTSNAGEEGRGAIGEGMSEKGEKGPLTLGTSKEIEQEGSGGGGGSGEKKRPGPDSSTGKPASIRGIKG